MWYFDVCKIIVFVIIGTGFPSVPQILLTMKNKFYLLFISFIFSLYFNAQGFFVLTSPDGKLSSTISLQDTIKYDITIDRSKVMNMSPLYMKLENGDIWGINSKLIKSKTKTVDETILTPFYRHTSVADKYNALLLFFDKKWSLEFRAYNDGIAYRFINENSRPFNILYEHVEFRYDDDFYSYVPYVPTGKDGDIESQFYNSFENTYTECKLSELKKERLVFLPMMVVTNDDVKVCITESGLENYPGLYLICNNGTSLKGVHARYPRTVCKGGWHNIQAIVKERELYIAKIEGKQQFPWRISIVSDDESDIASSNLSYLLGQPSRVNDISWVKPGKVAWEWWNDWSLDGVDFETGINNDTYKAYIDFASDNNIEYVILDEGWAVKDEADLMKVVDDIDIKYLVDYASERNVGIILWAGYYAFNRDIEGICKYYSDLGIKGFKVDFMDRDDQIITDFNYKAAAVCAKYKLLLDLHGTSKPAGLNRTYPNVINFEGVHGLEQLKFRSKNIDQVKYDVLIPFIRQVSGPLDYTQGAMRNVIKKNYYPCYNEPMSQGTRCRQLALYVIFDSPLNMLCDSPSNYVREKECTDFIASIPTVWDETRVLNAELGKYIVTARRKGKTWYIGGINDWETREIELDLSFISGINDKNIVIYKDGVNAHKIARDYKKIIINKVDSTLYRLKLAPGGGFAIEIN